MKNQKIKISTIVESQLPDFVKEGYPLVSKLLTEYYKSLETIGSSLDIIQNIDEYIKINNISNLIESTVLSSNVSIFDDVIYVDSTNGFPKTYGLVLIDDEIILYKSKTNNSFNECVRGFSGIIDYNLENLQFSDSQISSHITGQTVKNLNSLFLKEFLIKTKNQIAFGFEDTDLYLNLNENLFLKQSRDFYSSKGSSRSFEILFRVLYGKDVEVILPRDYLISPSNAEYRVTRNLVIEPVEGNPEELINKTIFQDQYNNIPQSFATVLNVQKFIKNGIKYYVLMLDYDFDKDIIVSGSIFGDLKIHPKTTVIENVQKDAKEIAVESTLGFDDSGELILNNGVIDLYVTYSGKTVNQFLNCTGVVTNINAGTSISINSFAYAYANDRSSKIKFRISGVLSDTEIDKSNSYHTERTRGKVISLGYNSSDIKDNCWIVNKTVKCNVSSFEISGTNSYIINTFDDTGINSGDSVEIDIIRLVSGKLSRELLVISGNQVVIPVGSIPGKKFQINNINYEILNIFSVKRLIRKYKGKYLSDVLNVYKNFNDNKIYITSSSLPSYGFDYSAEDYSFKFNTNFYDEDKLTLTNIGDHGLLTGDAVEYIPENTPNSLNIRSGIYFVERENSKEIKLYRSRSNIYKQKNNLNEKNHITFNTIGIGTQVGTILSSQPSTIIGINTLGFGISIGNYVFDSDLYNNQKFIKDNTKIVSIGQNTITLSNTHNSTFNSLNSTFSFREPTNDYLKLLKFSKNNNTIDSQKLVRVIDSPRNDEKIHTTSSGPVGILVNGVEILNYKSDDFIYYGPIESIKVINTGRDYDLINPPILTIEDPDVVDNICDAHCHVEGQLERIDIIDPGFNYLDVPIVTIKGGNGYGASAVAKLIDYDYSVDINSSPSNDKINLNNDELGFSTSHRFYDGESIVYRTYGNTAIGGITTDANYYVSIVDDYKINLHKNFNDALNKTNKINLTSYGSGTHKLEPLVKKKRLNSIVITNSGQNYKNKKITVPSSGINTASDTINVYNHPYLSGEIIHYYGGEENISGLSTGSYIVTKINDTSFKLSNIGIGTIPKEFYYNTKQYVSFNSSGSGIHAFNYEPITVEITGKTGISTNYSSKIQPVFRGKISTVHINDSGVGYGSSDIINYNKQPKFILHFGFGAKVTPIISNGRILDVIITEFGSEYNSPPDIVVKGNGSGAVLTPILKDGKLIDVKVINGGIGYNPNNTVIEVVAPGTGVEFYSTPKIWTINHAQRIIETNKVTSDESVVYRGNNKNYGLQYTHLYAPKILRKSLFSVISEDGILKYRSDYDNDKDINIIKYHSPIVGWAYDGNPIYGPYGYTSIDHKTIKSMNSGYEVNIDNLNIRPSIEVFPIGYFVEDYKFTGSGDLDEHNGRYCVTPDYPDGTYAYFMTIDSEGIDVNKDPKFPYIVGNTYKSKPIDFNFSNISNQEKFLFDDKNLIRNTTHYNTLSENSRYEYFLNKDDVDNQNIKVNSIQTGGINSIKIISGGSNYKVNDNVVFDNDSSGGTGASAKVELITGKEIVGISKSTYSIDDVEFYLQSNTLIGFASYEHTLSYNDTIIIDSLNKNDSNISGLYNIINKKSTLVLDFDTQDASSTGIVTYFYVSGVLDFPYVSENDVFNINDEDIKILNIDKDASRIRVLREYNSTSSSNHSAYDTLNEKSRKVFIDIKNGIENNTYNINREIYFNPIESLGIGTEPGTDYTLYFSNPGIGKTSLVIPTKTIYIKNHNLNTNDKLTYKSNSQTPIVVSDGIIEFDLENNSDVFVKKISDDLIGISTVGIETSLFFVDIGGGEYHSFTTNLENAIKGSIVTNYITVSTATNNNLSVGDNVYLDVKPGISTTINLSYDTHNRRLLVDPRTFNEVDLTRNTITIPNHRYKTGDKLLYTSSILNNNLIGNNYYYAIVHNKNKIKLSNSYYNSIQKNPIIINFLSEFSGTLSKVNPQIEIIKNNLVKFDLSDSSLSEISGGSLVESFDFSLFTDSSFSSKFVPLDSNKKSKIKKIGTIGVDCEVSFKVDDNFPDVIYYNLIPKSNNHIKNELYTDTQVINYNQITFKESKLNGVHVIKSVEDFSFYIQLPYIEDFNSYASNNSILKYYTDSLTDSGSINKLRIISSGNFYEKLPSISNVNSLEGSGAILIPQGQSIGKLNSTEITNNNYKYPIDNTLKPLVKFSSIVRLEPLNTIKDIKVIYPGLFYNTPPDLVVIDGFTNKVIDDVELKFDIDSNSISIIKNTKGIYNAKPKIISVNNTNGIVIYSISYNNDTKIVNLYLSTQFSDPDEFPISIGDKIFVEGVSIVNGSGKGFNSKNYNYSLFTITNTFLNLGGSGSFVQYSLEEHLTGSQTPGIIDEGNSSITIVKEEQLPKFEVNLIKNSFIIGEEVSDGKNVGTVLNWDSNNEYLTVEILQDFNSNLLITGKSSKSQAFIKEVFPLEKFYNVKSSNIVRNGWNKNSGFLNNSTQRIHDNDYYQYFSYSIKSEIPIDKWDRYVDNLNHTLGFKRFSDLILNSIPDNVGIQTIQNNGSFTAVCELNSIVDVDCIKDFDLVSENYFYTDKILTSDEIIFNSEILIDYAESIGNRALIIDDISKDFNTQLSNTFVSSFNI